ncbi:hypothetical protein C0Z16_18640 [Paraburkholderia rhynchosiae]|uniref:Uncharacterized protein n=1 Tax=Paraburkholderia rhynchosiae TaxID=487049 RepID=A0ABX4V352_9BURK|nr:hypothetical protein C0Z16_18640 [Paraburkholderia rhynchosiae]
MLKLVRFDKRHSHAFAAVLQFLGSPPYFAANRSQLVDAPIVRRYDHAHPAVLANRCPQPSG